MLVLASQSATRKTLLANAGIAFAVDPASIDERAVESCTLDSGADSAGVALALARAKALNVSARRPGDWVVGSDQTLSLGGEMLHKPESLDHARAQLKHLRGKTHHLHAAVALACDGQVLFEARDSARLVMRDFSDHELDAVLALEGDLVLASVGGYRLEGASLRLFAAIEGDYFTILGLPLLALLEGLRRTAPHLLEG